MVDPIDDINRQARQGSVSAIIQVLNETLADSGVRTRAMFSQGVLQLLCEAAEPQQMEQTKLVPQVRNILESLQPRNVRRVNINSRIVREQQLLWLDEISRDPENQLLWSEEIVLARPNLFRRIAQDWKDRSDGKVVLPKASPVRLAREKRVFWRGLLGGASLSLLILLLGWVLHDWLRMKTSPSTAQSTTPVAPAASNPAQPAASSSVQPAAMPSNSPAQSLASPPASAPSKPAAPPADGFAQAVRTAESAVAIGQKAKTPAEWLDLAARWQRASDLMAQVTPQDKRYAIAQDRVKLYRQNSEEASKQAQLQRQGATSTKP